MWLIKILAVLVVSAPVSVFGTFALGPLWALVETRYGIESVGHAMYAGWCFVTTYAVTVMLGLLLVFASPTSRPSSPPAP